MLALAVATVYAGPYIGQPLFCGGVYAETTEPWIALPYRDYGDTWECGDLIYLYGTDANGADWHLVARAMDTGPFGAYCVEMGDSCPPIVADIPAFLAPFAGLSSPVRVVNVTRASREMGLSD